MDNYTLDPRMLTWTSILTKIFDLHSTSNVDERGKKLLEYASLSAKIKSTQDIEEKKKKFAKLKKLIRL